MKIFVAFSFRVQDLKDEFRIGDNNSKFHSKVSKEENQILNNFNLVLFFSLIFFTFLVAIFTYSNQPSFSSVELKCLASFLKDHNVEEKLFANIAYIKNSQLCRKIVDAHLELGYRILDVDDVNEEFDLCVKNSIESSKAKNLFLHMRSLKAYNAAWRWWKLDKNAQEKAEIKFMESFHNIQVKCNGLVGGAEFLDEPENLSVVIDLSASKSFSQ
jgi:hypothetical protein